MTSSSLRPALLSGIAALSLLAPGLAYAGMKVDTSVAKPDVHFHANGEPGALDIDAKTTDCAAADDGTNLTFTVKMDTVQTGIELRDEHMKTKFLHTETYPDAVLVVAKAAVPWPTEVGKKATGTVDAQFTAHGVTQPTKVTYEVTKTKQGWRVIGNFAFDISKHGIDVPSYLGVTVEPALTARATIYLADMP